MWVTQLRTVLRVFLYGDEFPAWVLGTKIFLGLVLIYFTENTQPKAAITQLLCQATVTCGGVARGGIIDNHVNRPVDCYVNFLFLKDKAFLVGNTWFSKLYNIYGKFEFQILLASNHMHCCTRGRLFEKLKALDSDF